MDSLGAELIARYPRCRWARMQTHYAGRCGPVVVAVFPAGDRWQADGQLGPGRLVHHGEGADVHAALASLARCSPAYVDALHPTPYEKPQERPFPASGLWWLGKGCLWVVVDVVREVLPSRWTVLLLGMALGCGALCMGWLSGGAP